MKEEGGGGGGGGVLLRGEQGLGGVGCSFNLGVV